MRKLVLCLSLIVPLAGAADLAGTWHFEAPAARGPNGQPGRARQANYVFKVDGNRFTGVTFDATSHQQIIDGVIDGGQITFKVRNEWDFSGRGPTPYKGTLTGDELTIQPANFTPPTTPSQTAGRGGRGGAMFPLALHKVSSETEYIVPPEMQHQPFPPFKPIKTNGLALTPPMGWNSWNKFAGKIDDATVRGMADAMVSSGMKDAGYIYVNIDDTWEGAARRATATSPPTRSSPT